MTLTIYTEDYDREDAISKGLSGHVFLDPSRPGEVGCAFGGRLSEALDFIWRARVEIDGVTFCYRDSEGQAFRRFTVEKE